MREEIEINLNNESDLTDNNINDLHTNKETVDVKIEEKEKLASKNNFSPFSIVGKAIPLAFGMAAIALLLTVVLYFLLK